MPEIEETCAGCPARRDGVIDAALAPGIALLLLNVALYATMADFALRTNTGGLTPLVTGAFFLGVFLGGVAFPRLTARGATRFSAIATILWLAAAPLAVLPGFPQYALDDPLRSIADFLLGLMIAPVYRLFFFRFPAARRGAWFGLSLGAGVLCWNLLIVLANSHPPDPDVLIHPFLQSVYWIRLVSLAAVAALCVYGLALRPGAPAEEEKPRFAPSPEADGAKASARVLMGAKYGVGNRHELYRLYVEEG